MSSNFLARGMDGGTLFNMGLSTVIKVAAQPGQVGFRLNNISGGTLWISGGTNIFSGGSLVGTTHLGVGVGYIIPSGDRYFDYQGEFYLSASGATVVCSLIRLFNAPTGYINNP